LEEAHTLHSNVFTRETLVDREERGAERRIIFERCIIEYNRRGIGRASFKFFIGDKLREEMEEGKGMKRFSVHFNEHVPLQIVLLTHFQLLPYEFH
jgi:hypothetical protein